MEQETTSSQPLLNTKLRLFLLAMVLANVGGNMYGSLLPLYLKELNANVLQVGLFFTLTRIFPLVLQILGGWISDSLGRLRSIAWGSMAGVLSYAGLIFAPTWQWILLGEGLNAVTRSLIGPSFPAFIAEQSTEANRARVFAISQTIFGVVSVVGPPLGGRLADVYGFRWMLVCAAGFYVIAAIIRVSMARDAARSTEARPKPLSLASLRGNLGVIAGMILAGGLLAWLMLTDGITDVAFSLSFDLLPLYIKDIGGLSGEQIGWLFSIFGVFNVLASIPGGWLADKFGERVSIVVGFALQSAAMLIFLRVAGFWPYAAVWALFGIGVGLIGPAYQSLTSKAIPAEVRGTAFGLLHTSLGVFSLPAPAIGAQLWERVNPQFPFQLTAWALLLAIVPAWFKFRLPKQAAEGEDVEGG